jgi:peptidoglycan/xylan/chitin deacetylase (PgdA/CDA1 family)
VARRLTRFQCLVGGTLLAVALIAGLCHGVSRLLLLSLLFTVSGLGIGLGVSFPQWQMFGESLCRVRASRRAVALTFDDGPDPQTTPLLLELLARRGVKAAFFCVGEQVARQPELARQIAAQGHLVENHSYQHHRWTNLFSVSRLRADLNQAQAAIRQATSRAPVFFRPPMGLTNQRVFAVARELGLRVAGYTARGCDKHPVPPERIVARLLRRLSPGAIFLLHDGGVPASQLLAVVTMLLDKLEVAGYTCLRLDELIAGEGK